MSVPGLILLVALQALITTTPLHLPGVSESFPLRIRNWSQENLQALAVDLPGREKTPASPKALCASFEVPAASSPVSKPEINPPPRTTSVSLDPPRGRAPPFSTVRP